MLATVTSQSLFEEPAFWAAIVLIVGLALCARGLLGYRRSLEIKSIGTSRIATAAVGEVRLSGRAVPIGAPLSAPESGAACVYYRLEVMRASGRGTSSSVSREVRSTVFALDDGSGRVTVFPRAASWDVPDDFVHAGPGAVQATDMSAAEIEIARARLLVPQQSTESPIALVDRGATIRETRVDVGDVVTIIGSLLPFGELGDVFEEDSGQEDPIVAMELAEARASGDVAPSPEQAWGNAAIPGFGIGRPTRTPVLDPAAHPETVVAPAPGERRTGGDELTFDPAELVVAAGPGHPLAIFAGTPGQAVVRAETDFVLGLIGAVLAIVAAAVLALLVSGTFPGQA